MAAEEASSDNLTDEVQPANDTGGDHEEYLSHRERLLAGVQYHARSYDKWLLTLSGGALALSMTFCKDVVVGTPQDPGWLLASWILFAASIAMILACIILSQYAHDNDVEILDRLYGRNKPGWQAEVHKRQTLQCKRKAIDCLNWASLVSFLVGLVFIAIFVAVNLERV